MRRTAVYRDPLFLAHQTGRYHLESPERLRTHDRELDRPEVAGQFVFPDFPSATIAAVQAISPCRQAVRMIRPSWWA